jgi:hypothetical protein
MMGAYYSVTSAIKQAGEEIRVRKYAVGCEVYSLPKGELVSRQIQSFDRVSQAQYVCRAHRARRAAWLMTESDDAMDSAEDFISMGHSLREAVKAAIA